MVVRRGVVLGLALGVAVARAEPPQRETIRGLVIDVRGQPIRGAKVTFEGSTAGVSTDADGRFVLRDGRPGASLIVTKEGFAVALADATAAPAVIVLRPEGEAGETITVRGEAPLTGQGAIHAEREELQRLPGTGGDLMQTLSAMPGVTSTAVPLGFSGIVIRGSSPQDSKILVDDFAIPRLYHDLGFRSIVREESIDSLDYIPGGFDVAYGRATSGIVNLTTRAGDNASRAQGETSTEDVGALVQGQSGRLRYLFALRRSTLDLLLQLFPPIPDLTFDIAPRYYDEQLRLDYRLSSRWDLRVSSVGSDDAYALYASGTRSRDKRVASRNRFIRTTAAATFHDGPWNAKLAVSGLAQEQVLEIGATQYLRLRSPELAARAELVRVADEAGGLTAVHWRLGGELVRTRYDADVALPEEVREGETPAAMDPEDTSLRVHDRVITSGAAAWTSIAANLDRRIRATAGFRVDRFTHSVALQPRAELAVRLAPKVLARISAGAFARPPEYQTELLAPKLAHERATQLIAGVAYEPAEGARFQATAYVTDRRGLIARQPDGELANTGAVRPTVPSSPPPCVVDAGSAGSLTRTRTPRGSIRRAPRHACSTTTSRTISRRSAGINMGHGGSARDSACSRDFRTHRSPAPCSTAIATCTSRSTAP